MPNTRYRKGKRHAAAMALYSRQMAADNSQELSRLKRNLIRALQEDVTQKQRQALLLYYAEGQNMREIGEKLGVELPITDAVYDICFTDSPLSNADGKNLCMDIIMRLFSRDTKFEF